MGVRLEVSWILCRSGVQFRRQYNRVLGAANLVNQSPDLDPRMVLSMSVSTAVNP